MTAQLRFAGVTCIRGGRALFRGLDFSVDAGGAALITGANGVGKSSLLRVAAGLLTPADGQVTRTGAVALADEGLALDVRLPLADALGFWAGLDGGADRLGPALAALGLAHLAPVPVRLLSTGQRKRAVLARVLASGAGIWLLDEPGNGLDDDGLARLAAAIAAHRATGGIVLAASHQPLGITDALPIRLVA